MQRLLEMIDRRILGIGVATDLAVLGVGFAIVGLNSSETEKNVVLVAGLVASFVVTIALLDREFRRRDRSARSAAASESGAVATPDK
jgi:Kef-type K+ transport system membrane component KefB